MAADLTAIREAFFEGALAGGNMRVGEDIGPHWERWWERHVFNTALDAGTAAMVAKQIESHITLPAFIKESVQFENVTEPGKDEWRRVFRAGLDAFHAAGGTR